MRPVCESQALSDFSCRRCSRGGGRRELKAHPGKITDEELERETGGTGLRYSFDIKSGSSTQEVGVDARTGRVLENAKEGENPD